MLAEAAAHVWESVERAFGFEASEAGNVLQFMDEPVAPTPVLGEHFADARLRRRECRDGSRLRDGAWVARRVALHLVHLSRPSGGSNRVADAPARHRVGLR